MNFNYFYKDSAELYSFYRIPKILLTDNAYAYLSVEAKLLYGLVMDRMGMSLKNKWLDDDNRVYIIYPISEIQEELNVSRKKAMEYLSELETYGLVAKKSRGLGLPSLLYPLNFVKN